MKKSAVFISTLILLALLLPLNATQVNAERQGWDEGTNGAAAVIHATDVGSPPNNTEISWVQYACSDIYSQVFEPQRAYLWTPEYVWVDVGHAYSYMYNYMVNYESATTYSYVTTDVARGETHSTHCPFATFLYIGHNAYQQFYGVWHYGFLGHGKELPSNSTSIDKIWDANIYGSINDLRHHFVFLWVCRNGNEGGGIPPSPPLPYGMPYCWTHGQITSSNGYASPDYGDYCVISFENMSPMISEPLDYGVTDSRHKHWLVFFYYALVECGYSVNDALDQASVWSGYPGGFTQTKLCGGGNQYYCGEEGIEFPPGWYYSKMRVYGDGTMDVPGDLYISLW